MPYRIKSGEPLRKAARRIVREQLTRPAAALKAGTDRSVAVHDARKALKRARALLRLIRAGLPHETYERANHRLRDAARSLSSTRDRDVLDSLLATVADGGGRAAAAAMRLKSLLADANGGAEQARPQLHDDASAEILAAAEEIRRMRIGPASADVLAAGLVAGHRAGRRALAAVQANPEAEEPSHELRKAAQTHWRHMLLLQLAWPEALKSRGSRARRIADLLGEDHDLALLDGVLAGPLGERLTPADRRALAAWSARRHATLKAEALPAAELLFAERPGDFAARITGLWMEASRRAGDERRKSAGDDAAPGPASVASRAESCAGPSASLTQSAVATPSGQSDAKGAAGSKRERTPRRPRKTVASGAD